MTASRRRSWADMDHDDELLCEVSVRRDRTDERGPIPELLAKKQAEQAHKTWIGYRLALSRFHDFLGEDAIAGDIDEAAGFRFLTHLRSQGLSDNAIAGSVGSR
jgi:hypothetical protein